MSAERWELVDRLLQSAMAVAPDERDNFLQHACGGDGSLIDEIKSLLTADRRAAAFLERPAVEIAAQALARSEGPEIPPPFATDVVPNYRILKPIGRGGMGSVWLAERSDGRFERKVAIKFINLAMIGSSGVDRFRREGKVLGRLSHPHIAELIDAGVTPTDEPYLVLEYVEGQPIDRYCDAHSLGIDRRIALFLDVLNAVSHAHANLIVHRDIKPSNVLVRDDGHVTLLDFGIAKLLADGEDAATALTLDGGGVLTPRFAAPEQFTHGAVTTATDVYALGVLLYLLLTGHHPAGPDPLAPAQLMKAIVEDETRRASDAIGRDDGRAAQQRATTPERLRRQLRGDLDTILNKALKKDPADRYATVSALADDLERYRRHEPIRARPDSIRYRAGKFVLRNRAAVMLASLVLLAITAGMVGTLVEARSARRERDFAIHQVGRAEAINELNTLVLEEVQSPEMMDRAERILAQQQDASVADRVEVLIALAASVDISKDGGARSRRLLDQAYQLSRGLPEPSTRARASCALAGEVSYGADAVRSEALVQEGLDALPHQPEFALDRVFCLRVGGAVSRAKGAGSEAIERLQAAQRLLKEAPIPSWRLEFLTTLDLGNALRLAGRYGEASAQFEQIAARLTAEGRGDTGAAASVQYSWGVTLSQLGRPMEAEARIRRAIAIDSGREDSPTAVPWQLIALAAALRDLGRLDDASMQAERGYARSLANGDDTRVNQALLLRASIYRKRGEMDRAREMLSEAEARLRRSTPSGNIIWASLLLEQALAAQDRGDLPAAVDGINRALTVADASVKAGKQGADLVAVLLVYRSDAERQLGRADDAIGDATRALVQIKAFAQPGTFSQHAGRAYLALGRALQSQGKALESHADFQLAAEHFEKSLGPASVEARQAGELAGTTAR